MGSTKRLQMNHIYGAKTGDWLGTFYPKTGELMDIQGRQARVDDLESAVAYMRTQWSWVV